MICPKCGYEQEESLDCLKCGIVFSKFFALHAPDKPVRVDAADVPQTPNPAQEDNSSFASIDLAELRLQVRDLSRRSSGFEFERAERLQIRSELRDLQEKSEAELGKLMARLEALGKMVSAPPVPQAAPAQQEWDEWKQELQHSHLDPLHGRLDQIDQRIEMISAELRALADPSVLETLKELDGKIGDLEVMLVSVNNDKDSRELSGALLELQVSTQSLRSEVDSLKAAVARLEVPSGKSQARSSDENGRLVKPQLLEESEACVAVEATVQQLRPPLSEDMRCIRDSLEQIRQFITRLDPNG